MTIAGYTYHAPTSTSPVSQETLDEILASALWSEDDTAAIRAAGEILVPRTEEILDVWYGFVGATPHLVATFAGSDHQPDGEYLARVRGRFGQWIADLCGQDFDRRWLDYQEEIGLRHHTAKKNVTDDVDSPSGHVPLSHLIALIVPITVTIRSFLAEGESDPEQVDRMYHAWMKAVTVSVVLWTRPYSPSTW